MKSSSPLGAAIELAVSVNPKFITHRKPVKYLCYFRTLSGRVFAFERVTKSQITLWLPEDANARAAAEAEGLLVTKSEPFQDSFDARKYGRISSLAAEPQLKHAPLYRIPVYTVSQAVAVLGALS